MKSCYCAPIDLRFRAENHARRKSETGGAPSGRSGRVFGGAGAVMVPVLMVTVCPFVIEVELRLMS